MAAGGGIEGVKENLAEGHLIQYSLGNQNFSRPFALERSFNFDCHAWPTSWTLRVDFEVTKDGRILSGNITIRRTDESPEWMKVEFWMKLVSAPLGNIPPIRFNVPCIRNECVRDWPFRRIMQYQGRRRIDEQNDLVQLCFTVSGCHKDSAKPQRPSFALCSKI